MFSSPLIIILLVKYSIAVFLTIFAPESFVNVAWDSAGVTTGPVTVPFVLSLGIGLSTAAQSSEGFGILTAASVGPIITVLLVYFMKKNYQKVKAVRRERKEARLQKKIKSNSVGAVVDD